MKARGSQHLCEGRLDDIELIVCVAALQELFTEIRGLLASPERLQRCVDVAGLVRRPRYESRGSPRAECNAGDVLLFRCIDNLISRLHAGQDRPCGDDASIRPLGIVHARSVLLQIDDQLGGPGREDALERMWSRTTAEQPNRGDEGIDGLSWNPLVVVQRSS